MSGPKEVFNLKLTDEELGLIEDALEQSKAFKVYGDGRVEHQAQIDSIIKKLYSEAWN